MPSTVANIFTVDSDHSSSVSRRARRRGKIDDSINDNLPLSVRRFPKTFPGRKDVSHCIIEDDVRRRLKDCQVLLSDIISPGSQLQHLTKHIKEGSNTIQIHNVAENDTTEKHSLSGRNELTATEPNSYVTRRTNSRRTKSIGRDESSNVNIVREDPHSIIHLDQSSIGTKSIAESVDLTQTFSRNDLIIQVSKDAAGSKPRRTTRGIPLKVLDSNENTIVSRTAAKRKSDNVFAVTDTGVSPPKQSHSTKHPVLEHSGAAVSSKSSNQKDVSPGTDKLNINAGTSIIHLDQSSVSTKSIAEIADLSQTFPMNDATSKTRRVTRRMSMKATESNNNTISSGKALQRKSHNIIPARTTDVSLSAVSEAGGKQSINTVTLSTDRSLDKLNNNAFKFLIVSIKRVATAVTEAELKRLKYEDSTQSNRVSQRPSSRIRWRPFSGIKVEQNSPARAKPKIVISSPIIEVPESPPTPDQNSLTHSYLAVSKAAPATQLDGFKMPHPPLPQLIEQENEENDDVYEFLSSSQNSGITKSNKTSQKPKKASASSVNNKRKATAAKPKAKPPKQVNPFGCNKRALRKVIEKLGGGPVKQPATMGYKINLEIPKTPPVAASPVAEPQPLDNIELPYDDYLPSVEVSRICNPTVQRLKAGQQSSLPRTSTPANRLGMVDNVNVTTTQKPASPWRLQDEITIPRTSYTHRTKEMLPSYESFATENNVPVKTSAFITERRKSPNEGAGSIGPAPVDAPESRTSERQSGEGIVSDKELREFEQMYLELKVTSEMSQKLIKAMRMSKKNPTTPQQNHTMRLACLKLKKWYDRSMNAFSRSMRIINNLQQTTEQSASRAMACPSPLSLEQQRTLNNFNSSTDHFRSMIDQLQSAINDSDVENRPPPTSSFEAADTGRQRDENGSIKKVNGMAGSKPPKDVVILPDRGVNAKRNPLMPLNVVPLPQRTSPMMSPLARNPTTGPNNIRRELLYDKENESSKISDKPLQKDIGVDSQIPAPELPDASVGIVVEINDTTAHNDCANNNDNTVRNSKDCSTEATENTENCFGFDDGDSVEEPSAAQVTLPMPLNISHETLQRRLQNMKQLLPKRPIFRKQPKQQNRTSGPTRFPATKLRVFGSPTKRPHTLREFVASTPRPAGSSTALATVPSKALLHLDVEAPDVSAIEPITESAATVEQKEHEAAKNNEPDVVLFDTPDRPEWLNNSAHQRTYARKPRRKKKNVYLANLGLDDDSEDEENASPQELSSDSETEVAKRKKKPNKRKAHRKQPVEETENFKQFVESFNSMCEEVERYELIIE